MANVFSDKALRFQDLQTRFDYRSVIVVARGAAKEGHDYRVQFSGSDQKSAARCVSACGDPRQRSSETFSQQPAVTGPLLCGPIEVDTEAASLGSSPVATGLVSAHSKGELSPQ